MNILRLVGKILIGVAILIAVEKYMGIDLPSWLWVMAGAGLGLSHETKEA